MKTQLLVAITAIVVAAAFSMAWALTDSTSEAASTMKSSAALVGHLTLTATNEDGEIIAYRQTDNVVVNDGDDCILEYITGASVTGCGATTADIFRYVHIGTGGVSPTETTASITTWKAASNTSTGTITPASGTDTPASVILSTTFDNVSASINEAEIRNGASSSGTDVLAVQGFTAIPLGATDDLTINWTISVDGS